MRKAGLWILWIGVVLGVASLAGGLVVAIGGFTHIGASADDDVEFDSQTTIEMEAGDRIAVYVVKPDTNNTRQRNGGNRGQRDRDDTGQQDSQTSGVRVRADCVVTGPDGSKGDFSGGGSSTVTRGGESWQASGFFTAKQDGKHSVSCTDSQKHILNEPLNVGGIFGGIGGILIVVFGGILAVTLFILGLVLWLVGRNSDKYRAQRGWYGY